MALQEAVSEDHICKDVQDGTSAAKHYSGQALAEQLIHVLEQITIDAHQHIS